jgi:hypothetical protein
MEATPAGHAAKRDLTRSSLSVKRGGTIGLCRCAADVVLNDGILRCAQNDVVVVSATRFFAALRMTNSH